MRHHFLFLCFKFIRNGGILCVLFAEAHGLFISFHIKEHYFDKRIITAEIWFYLVDCKRIFYNYNGMLLAETKRIQIVIKIFMRQSLKKGEYYEIYQNAGMRK